MDQEKLETIKEVLPRIPEDRQIVIADILVNPEKHHRELLNLFLSGNHKVHADNSREELSITMADMSHPEVRYSMNDRKYVHGYYWLFKGEINNTDGAVTVTLTELKHATEGYQVEKTVRYSKASIESLMERYPIESIYQQPTRERTIRADFDKTIEELHKKTEHYRKGNGVIAEREGLFAEKAGDPEFRTEVFEDIRRVIDDFALLHVFKNVNYDDFYGYLVTDLFGKKKRA
ncbi:hypothetical protein IKG20_03130 [Candidatus Saccharibacteria bacterium]|nr:hypothetical protein [Candidatus Saccharibacteria bacterium]